MRLTGRSGWLAHSFAAFLAGGLLTAAGCGAGPAASRPDNARPAQRLVSLVPAATEMLYSIGAGPRVVAVSSFDKHPPEVRSLPKVGALIDPDLERIITLKPDLVVAYASQDDLRAQLNRAAIPVYAYRHGGLSDVTRTIRELGERAGMAAEAARIASGIEGRLDAVRAAASKLPRPRVALVFYRQPHALRGIYATGGVGFLHDILEAAGGDNVFADIGRESIQVSVELLLARSPDVIVELRYGNEFDHDRLAEDRETWRQLPSLRAVRYDRIHVLTGDEFVVPGPRIAAATEKLAAALHPGVFEASPSPGQMAPR
jgi:iron complex transport system substrate-binding protein